MVQVVLGILKVIGILLAVLLGVVLLVLLAVLFVPIRYEAFGRKGEEIFAEGRVSWLMRIVTFQGGYERGKPYARLRIFGFQAADFLEEEEEPKSRKKKKPKKAKKQRTREQVKAQTVSQKTETTAEHQAAGHQAALPEGPENPLTKTERVEPEKKKTGFLAGLWKNLCGIRAKIRNLKYTMQGFCVKIKEGRDIVIDERTKAAFFLCKAELLRLLKKILPKKLKGELHFGFEDPALTGEILGGISIFYPLFMDNVKIRPDFEETCLDGELYFKGRVQIASLIPTVWRLFRDPNIRFLHQKFWA